MCLMKRLNQNKMMGILSCVVLFTIAIASDYKLMGFYVNHADNNNAWIADGGTLLETDYISNFWHKMQYVNFNGLMRNLLGQHEMNNIVKLKNGYLDSGWGASLLDEPTLDDRADSVSGFRDYLEQKGISFFYVTMPYVVDKYDRQLPIGINDYANQNLDALQEELLERDVKCMDLREAIHEDGLETYDIFFKTDHHWTTEGGFWAFQKITEYMEQEYGDTVDEMVKDIGNYDITTYEDAHLGSAGQRTGIYYAGIDDFDLIVPQFQTELTRMCDGTTGTFEEVLIDKAALQNTNYVNRYTYDSVLQYADDGIYNPDPLVDKKVLIIGDSMSKSVMPYMSLIYREVLFYPDSSDVSAIDEGYLETYQPDIVICMYYYTQLEEAIAYNFYSNQF